MEKKSIVKNYFYNLIYQILVLVIPIITIPYISRVLGAENIGIYSYTMSITTYFVTFGTLGSALYAQREIAFNQANKEKYSRIFYEVLFLRIITLSISILIFYIIFVGINTEYNIYYKILTLYIIGNMFDISWLYQGIEEFKKTVTRNIIVKIISVICIFLFVKSKDDLPIYFMIYILSVLLGNITLWLYLPKTVMKLNIKEINIFRHVKQTLILFIPQIAVQIYMILDKSMLGFLIADKTEVGYYDQAQKIIRLLSTMITSLGTIMMPRIAFTYSIGDHKKIKEYVYNSFRIVFMLSIPMILGICLVADTFVPIFFGEGYEDVSLLMKVISPILLFVGGSNVLGAQFLLPTKRQKEYTTSVVTGAIINFILNLILIPKIGALGASIGTIVAELSVVLTQLLYSKKDLDMKIIFNSIRNYVVAGLVMYITCTCINIIEMSNLNKLLIEAFSGMVVYTIVLIILKDKLIINIINRIKKKESKVK